MENYYTTTKVNSLINRNLSKFNRFVLIAIFLIAGNFVAAQNQTRLPAASGTLGGANNWNNTNRIYTDNNQYATNNLNDNETSRYITGSSYGFTIPATATITGIVVTIERVSSDDDNGNTVEDNNLRLLKAGALVGTNHANVGADWLDSNVVVNYGSATDMWGTTWTPAEINAAGFGAGFAVETEGSDRTASVDYIQIAVHYTNGPTITSFTPNNACAGTNPTITINGTGFTGATAVNFNGTAATTFTVVNATQITATLPTGATGGQISVTTPSGTATTASLTPSVFTVNPLPTVAATTGTLFVCPGSTTPLSNATPGGVWSSASPGIASVNASGVVSGVSPGTSVISYTVTGGNGCVNRSNVTVTVYSLPVISGNGPVCVGATVQLNAGTAGTWVSNNPAVASINNTGLVTGLSQGTATFTFTATSTGCTRTSAVITVNIAPSINAQPAVSQSVCSGASASFTVGAIGAGLTYQWFNGVNPLVNGGSISGANGTTLTLNPVLVSDASANYHCIVTGSCAPAIQSNNAALNVTQAVAIINQPITTQSLCTGNSASFSVIATGAGLTYQWYKGGSPLTDVGSISGSGSDTLLINPIVSGDAGSYHVVVSGTGPCLPVTSNNSILIVNNGPAITGQAVVTQTICAGNPASLTIVATGGSLIYQWYKGAVPVSNGGNISGATTGTLNFTPLTLADAAPDYYCVVSNGCVVNAVSDNSEIIVNQKPVIPTQLATVCSETAFVVNPLDGSPAGTIVPAGTTYTWTMPVVTGGMTGGSAQLVGQPLISQTLTNTTNQPQTATYTVTPTSGTSGACIGTNFTVSVTVNPLPYIINQTPSICSGEPLNLAPANGGGNIVPAGTTYSWGIPSVTGGLAGGTSGSGQASFIQTLTNPTNTTQTATYNVTATSGICAGSTFTITVSVNAKPTVSGTPATQPVCSGTAISPISLSNPNAIPGVVTYNWTRDNTANLTGIAATGSGSNISGTLVNTTGTPQTTTFTFYATSEDLCISLPSTVTVTVNPVPVPVATPASQTACSGINITTINLTTSNSVAATAFSWTRTNTVDLTGIADNGVGTSIAGTLTNHTNVPQTTTFTVTGIANGCNSTATFTITVSPKPTVSALPATQTICGATAMTDIVLSNPNAVSGTTITWTRNATASVTGIPNSGSGTLISGIPINTTNADVTVTFSVTATASGCASTLGIAQMVVKPAPIIVVTPATQSHCNNFSSTAIALSTSNNLTGTVFNWTRNNTANLTGIADNGTGNISGILANNTTTTQVTTFTITATAPNGCVTTTTTNVTIYATLTAPVISASQTVCVLSQPATLTMTTPVSGGSGVNTYQWQRADENQILTNTWVNVGTATTYSPPFIFGGDDNYYYRLVVTNICGSVTSNVVFIQVISSVGFTFNGVNDPAPLCPGGNFNTNISSDHATSSAVRYNYTADPTYVTGPAGSNFGTTSGIQYFLWIFPYRESSHNFPFTVQNTTNATVNTQITITPSVYIYGPPIGAFQCSITPQIVNVTIRPRPVATIISPAPLTTICSGTSANITGSGNLTDAPMNFSWTRSTNPAISGATSGSTGSVAVGGTFSINNPLTNNSAAAVNITYTITPSSLYGSNNCNGSAVTITITVSPNLLPGVVAGTQTICSGGNPAAFTQTTPATGVNLTYQWQSSTTGPTGPWTNITNATGTTYDDPGPVTVNTWYIRVVTSTVNGLPCSIQNTTPIAVTVNTVSPGTVSGTQTICAGGNPAAFTSTTASAIVGSVGYQWEYSTVDCVTGPWTLIGGNTQNIDVPAGLLVTTYYRRRATATTGSCSEYSNCIVVYVNNVTGGTVGSDQTLCGNNPAPFTVITPATGPGTLTYQWQSNTVGCSGTFMNISGAIGDTYDVLPGLSQTTYYKRIVTSVFNGVSCTAESNCITVTANTVTAGVIGANRTVCSGGDPAPFTVVTPASGLNITYQWQSSTTGGIGTWSDIPLAIGATYDAPGPMTQTMYYQRITISEVNSVACTAASNPVTVFVNDVTASVIAGDQIVCGTENPAAFTVTTAATAAGIISYQWQFSTISSSGPWTNIGTNSAVYDAPAIAVTTYYHVIVSSTLNSVACTATSNTLTITNNSKTWNGSISTDWNTAGNWTPNGVPTPAHCVVIPNTVLKPVISGSSNIGYGLNLSILNGGRLDVNATNSVFITNYVNVSPTGIFNIANNASLVQTDNVSNTGIVNMQRITPPMYKFDYTYWNSPMTLGTYTLGNLSPNTQFDKYYSWNPTSGGGGGNWVQESTSTFMNPTKGYIIRAPNSFSTNPTVTQPYTATFTGTPNNGNVLMPIAIGTLGAGTPNDKMNLIGNPYPSAVNANLFLNNPANAALLEGTIYFWTHHAPPSAAFANPFYGTFALNYSPNGYASYNALGGTGTVPSSYTGGQMPNGFIGAGQSFFAIGKANGNVLWDNSMRVTGNNNVFFRTTNQFTGAVSEFEKHRIWLNLADTQGSFSQILVGYAETATNDIDRNFDGESMNTAGVSFYSFLSDKHLAIQGRSLPFEQNDVVPLGYTSNVARAFTIGIDHLDGLFEDQHVYLEDKLLNVIHDIKLAPYSFVSEIGTFNDRFLLRYTNASLGTNNPGHISGVTAFIKDKKLFAEAGEAILAIAIFDISGKLIKTYKPETSDTYFESEFVFAEGVYLAKIKLESGVFVSAKLAN